MKIPNPFFQFDHTRWAADTGDDNQKPVCGVCDQAVEIEIPDDSVTCLLQAVDSGRSDAKVVYSERMWTRDFGLMGVGDWETKCKIEADRKEMEIEREKEAKRRAKEAQERGKVKKVIEEKRKPIEEKIEKPLEMGDKLKL